MKPRGQREGEGWVKSWNGRMVPRSAPLQTGLSATRWREQAMLMLSPSPSPGSHLNSYPQEPGTLEKGASGDFSPCVSTSNPYTQPAPQHRMLGCASRQLFPPSPAVRSSLSLHKAPHPVAPGRGSAPFCPLRSAPSLP